MPNAVNYSVMVDTSYLISLTDNSRPNYDVAKKFQKFMIDSGIKMYLSVINIAEYNQIQAITRLMNLKCFEPLPFNYDHAISTSQLAFQLGDVSARRDEGNPRYADDIKMIAQAHIEKIDYIISEDASTLGKYCNQLSDAGLINVRPILLKDGFDRSHFTGGQTAIPGL